MKVHIKALSEKTVPGELDILLPAILGRGKGCQLRIVHASVSRRHCELLSTEGGVLVRDLGSLNGILVNEKRVQEAVLAPGDQLVVGSARLEIRYKLVDGTQPLGGVSALASSHGSPARSSEEKKKIPLSIASDAPSWSKAPSGHSSSVVADISKEEPSINLSPVASPLSEEDSLVPSPAPDIPLSEEDSGRREMSFSFLLEEHSPESDTPSVPAVPSAPAEPAKAKKGDVNLDDFLRDIGVE